MKPQIACLAAALLFLPTGFAAPASAGEARQPAMLLKTVDLDRDPELGPLYAAHGRNPFWTGSRQADTRRKALLALLAEEHKAMPHLPDPGQLKAAFGKGDKAAQLQAELKLTRAALGYMARRRGGDDVGVPTARALRVMERLGGADPSTGLTLAQAELELVQELGGWREVGTLPGPAPTTGPAEIVSPEVDIAPAFPPRKRVPDVAALRRRLVQSGDLPAADVVGEELDDRLTAAVQRFQERHGLAVDGIVGMRTLAALNTPVGQHITQVKVNLARRHDDRRSLARYVEVNVPSYELRLIEKGRVALRSRVIVGDEESPTPIFDERIRYLEFNPFWYVPKSITPELLQKEAKERGYLNKSGFFWQASAEGGPPDRLVQRPGPDNALGRLKFLFPNQHSVYLHDTAQRALFSRSERSLSHGCVRVEKWMELAQILLASQGWKPSQLDAVLASSKTRRVELHEPVPIFLDYRTAFIDDKGRLNLRPDLYGHDGKGITQFRGKGLPRLIRPERTVPDEETILIRQDAPPPVQAPAPIPVMTPEPALPPAGSSTAQADVPAAS